MTTTKGQEAQPRVEDFFEENVAARERRSILTERWQTLTIGVRTEDAAETNSGLMDRWMEDTRQLAGRMVHGVHGDDEYSLLCGLEHNLLTALESQVMAFAAAVEEGRGAR
jgi:hypothetical protein